MLGRGSMINVYRAVCTVTVWLLTGAPVQGCANCVPSLLCPVASSPGPPTPWFTFSSAQQPRSQEPSGSGLSPGYLALRVAITTWAIADFDPKLFHSFFSSNKKGVASLGLSVAGGPTRLGILSCLSPP